MNFVPVITHALAILLGWLVVSVASMPDPDSAESSRPEVAAKPVFHPPTPHGDSHPRALLDALVHTPMEASRRQALKSRLYNDWSKTDPIGLLKHLDHRAWPGDTDAFRQLAKTHPGKLLAYARHHGCPDAIHALSSYGIPRTTLDLFLAQPDGSIPATEFFTVFASGSRVDPDFHLNIDRLTLADARLEAFFGSTKVLLDGKRYDTFIPWFTAQSEHLPLEPITRAFTHNLIAHQEDVTLINRLPESAFLLAIRQVLDDLTQLSSDQSYHRATLATYAENGWLDNHLDRARAVISDQLGTIHSGGTHLDEADAWRDWALALPDENGRWDSLRHTAIRRWILGNPDAWEQIPDLPAPALRNSAYFALLHHLDPDKESESIRWILTQISDPDLQLRGATIIAERGASVDDPFSSPNPFRKE